MTETQLPTDGADDLLRVYVSSYNTLTDAVADGMAVTLLVDGALVTGRIIPNWQWMDEMHSQITRPDDDSEDGDSGSILGDFAAELLQTARDRQSSFETPAGEWTEAQKKAHDQQTGFAHLRDASVLLGGGAMAPTGGTYLRVRLADISAWTIGSLSVGNA